MSIHIPLKITVKTIHFSNITRNKQHTSKHLSSDDDDYYQPDVFAPYTKEYHHKKLDKIKYLKK